MLLARVFPVIQGAGGQKQHVLGKGFLVRTSLPKKELEEQRGVEEYNHLKSVVP